MTNHTADRANAPTALLQARTWELVDEILRRGVSIDELCSRVAVANWDELRRLLGGAH